MTESVTPASVRGSTHGRPTSGRTFGGATMDLIEEHLAHLARAGYRPTTIRARGYALRRYERHHGTLLAADVHQLRAWTSRPTTRAAATAKEVDHLRAFFRWAVLEEHTPTDPTLRLERPTVPRGAPRPMPRWKVAHALHHAPERVRPWLHIAAYAGLRACEIAPLRGEDYDGRVLFIAEQKGGEPGRAQVSPQLARVLDTLPRSGVWFPARSQTVAGRGRRAPRPVLDRPITASQLSKLANRWLHEEGIAETLHTLRHFFGTTIRRETGDLELTRRCLRHQSVQSTVIYTAVDDDELAGAVETLPDLSGEEDDLPEAA